MSIPKNLFLYWSDNNLSYLRFLTVQSFKKFNSEWNITIFTSKNSILPNWKTPEQNGKYIGENYFDRLKEYGEIENIDLSNIGIVNSLTDVHKSDIVRYWCLNERGGIWSDFDILYFKPIPEYILNQKSIACFDNRDSAWSIGFIGCEKGDSFYNDLFNRAKLKLNTSKSYQYQTFGSWMLNGRDFTSYKNQFNDIYNIPMNLVYYINSYNISKIFEENIEINLPEETIGIHWYAGSEFTRSWENKLNKTTIKNFNNILCKKAVEIEGSNE